MRRPSLLPAMAVLLLASCRPSGGPTEPGKVDELVCDLDPDYLADSQLGRDGIPALSDPPLVPIHPIVPENSYVRYTDRIIAARVGEEWVVIPHNIMWRHEIVNFTTELDVLSVSYCPLTGSALAFSRDRVDGAEFGVSGLLYQANLIMYDRNEDEESHWPQMMAEARCGPRSGTKLVRRPLVEMTLAGWMELHPDTKMVAMENPNHWQYYVRNPYGEDYDDPDNADFQGFPISLDDDRLPPKERVLGLPADASGAPPRAFSFSAMERAGNHAFFLTTHDGVPTIVIWDGSKRAAMAYRTYINGREATFEVADNGVRDNLTGTVWAVDGTAVEGALVGRGDGLRPVSEAYVAFWAPWAAFHPETVLPIG